MKDSFIGRSTFLSMWLVISVWYVEWHGAIGAFATEPFQLNAQEKNFIPGTTNDYPSYPAPQIVPSPPTGRDSFSAGGSLSNKTLVGGVQKVVLPPALLGVWNVTGQRRKVEALPEFEQDAERAFANNNNQVWTIGGNPSQGYTLGSNTGIETMLIVDKVQGTTAFIRYQHPIGKTMAQEAVVISLLPGGAQFNGLERIAIVKEGLPQPRAKVTYELFGQRQK